MPSVAHAYVSIGSNLDEPVQRIRDAIETLRGAGMVTAVSPFYRTAPWGPIANQPDFVNAVVALDTHLTPRELLTYLKDAERRAGRTERGERWGPRRIDFDILTYDRVRLDEPDLIVPHPRMYERAFVLVPLADLDAAYAGARDALSGAERASVTKMA